MFLHKQCKKMYNYSHIFRYGAVLPSLRFLSSGCFRFSQPCNNLPPWELPTGFDTGIEVYNSAVKTRVPLITKRPGHLMWYMCGPTVYDSAHIGHGLCYLRFDIIRRILRDYFHLSVFQVMGVTDIDDKIIKKANYFKSDIGEVSRHFEAEFWQDMSLLGIQRPDKTMRVTEHIPHVIQFVQDILDAGFAYQVADGSVFFNNIAYRKSRGLHLPEDFKCELSADDSFEASQTDAQDPHKRHPIDFALWKGSKKDEPSWPSPFGRGRPGWHIECSAMASSVFGDTLDVHSGGIDLWFPHHYCEEAQCCARHSSNIWTNYWWHSGHLTIDCEKMSKSIGNVVSIRELLQTHSANTFRHFALTSHYTNPVTYGDSTLAQAANQVSKIQEMLNAAHHFLSSTPKVDLIRTSSCEQHPLMQALLQTKANVDDCLRHDFNTAKAMRSIFALISLTNKYLYRESLGKLNSIDSSRESSVSSQLTNSYNINLAAESGHCMNEVVDISLASSKELTSTNHENSNELELHSVENELGHEAEAGQEAEAGHVEIAAVRNYVLGLMTLLGMNYKAGHEVQSSKSESLEASSDLEKRFPDVMQALLTYRNTVRDFALLKNIPAGQFKALSKEEQRARRQEMAPLLQAGDELRTRLNECSILIKDLKEGSSWTFSDQLAGRKADRETEKN
ncbi:probable cysteine--tRNA ligase, mitochondrial [Hyalella azteca]|uniref:cysteine--tRNA ligase n=1 Tax=Hyalella azteca TaxID=294128 RepID=A0A8B7PIZ9_HYAAZ|nr:probable cysteine--tRNA ligase, mitochondrial [Hyalella azteca]